MKYIILSHILLIRLVIGCDYRCVSDITNFTKANGFKQAMLYETSFTLIQHEWFKMNSKLVIKSLVTRNLQALKNLDLLIINSSSFHSNESVLVSLLNHKVRQTIVITNDFKSTLNFTKKVSTNQHLYIYDIISRNWQEVLRIKDNTKVIVNPLKFDKFGRVKMTNDLQGITLTSTTLPWSPYIFMKDCNEFGQDCKVTGALFDLVTYWSKALNFTLKVFKDVNDDWGTEPKSGKKKV